MNVRLLDWYDLPKSVGFIVSVSDWIENPLCPGLEVKKLISCSTQLSKRFKLLINTKIFKIY